MKNCIQWAACCLLVFVLAAPAGIAGEIYFQRKLDIPSGNVPDLFGRPVLVKDDYLFISATGGAVVGGKNWGRTYVYKKSGRSWNLNQELTAGGLNDHFGHSLAANGKLLVVGATDNPGCAHVFMRLDDIYQKVATLTIPDGQPSADTGWAVALNDKYIVVTAPRHTLNQLKNAGCAFIFKRKGTTWALSQTLTAPDGAENDRFGSSVALLKNTLAISSIKKDRMGGVYLFALQNGVWRLYAQLQEASATKSYFGFPLRFFGDQLYVGATGYGADNTGCVFIYGQVNGRWENTQQVIPPQDAAHSRFGMDMAVHENLLAVGAPDWDDGEKENIGAVYVFEKKAGKWNEMHRVDSPDGEDEDGFGHVAMTGAALIVGAPFHGLGERTYQGAAYIFEIAN